MVVKTIDMLPVLMEICIYEGDEPPNNHCVKCSGECNGCRSEGNWVRGTYAGSNL